MACRPLPEHELWVADLAMVLSDRVYATERRNWLAGSPELASEVLSPSNSKRQMEDRKQTFFSGGCLEFWIVDPDQSIVSVSRPDGRNGTFGLGDEIPLDPFGDGVLPVDKIFKPEVRNPCPAAPR